MNERQKELQKLSIDIDKQLDGYLLLNMNIGDDKSFLKWLSFKLDYVELEYGEI